MGSSGGSSSSTVTTGATRYAPYVEERHSEFLNVAQSYRQALQGDSPYKDYVDIPLNDIFFGTGFVISSFPALYDMYGKHMAGLDIEAIWSNSFETILNSTAVDNLVSAEAVLVDDDIETQALPNMCIAMRNANAVSTSTFIINKALIERSKVKSLSQFSGNLKYNLIPEVQELWRTQLNWNKAVIGTYSEIIKLYYSLDLDVADFNYGMKTKDVLWPFTVLEFEGSALAALQGAKTQSSSSKTKGGGGGENKVMGAVSGALSGAAIGSMIMPGWGTAIGGVIGLAASLF